MASIEKREGPKGVGHRVKVRIKGEKPRTRTFKRKTDAALWSKKVESDLGHGVYVPTTADRRRTLAELIDKYELEVLPGLPNKDFWPQLIWWREHAGHLTLDRLTGQAAGPALAAFKPVLLRRITRNGKPISKATMNRYYAALSKVTKWAWKEIGWLRSNPVLAVTKAPENEGIVRFLSEDERRALIAVCKASPDLNIYCAVMLALATGARYSNIRNLTWADVDLENWRLRFKHTKNGTARYVPVVGLAQAALREQFDRDPTGEGWVFKGYRDAAPADLNRPWREVRAAAGLVGDQLCRFHDLRHTTASYLTMNGASLAEVAAALGQKTLVMALRYSHQSGEHVRATFERISDQLGEK